MFSRFCRLADKLCHFRGDLEIVIFPVFRPQLLAAKNKKEQRISPLLPACTLPQVLRHSRTIAAMATRHCCKLPTLFPERHSMTRCSGLRHLR